MLLLAAEPALAAKGDYVVLLHGIGRTAATMTRMQHYFEKRSYKVLNLDYASRKHRIDTLADRIHPAILDFNLDKTKQIHFVGYSLGRLVSRAYADKYRPENMGRIVTIGTPNYGSEVADTLQPRAVYRAFFGPAGQELTTESRTAGLHPAPLPKPDYDLGCIAGDRTVDPISSYMIIDGPDDGKVSVKSATYADGAKDHITMHANHTFLAMDIDVIKQVRYFIERGEFKKGKPVTP